MNLGCCNWRSGENTHVIKGPLGQNTPNAVLDGKAEKGGLCCNRGEAPINSVPCAPTAARMSLDEAMQAKDAVTEAERELGSRVVEQSDLDKDGMLNKYEFNWMVTLCGGLPMNAAKFTTLSERLGATGAGPSLEQSLKAFKFQYNSPAKFTAAVQSFNNINAQLERIFNLCNMKQDGLVSYREFCWMRSASGETWVDKEEFDGLTAKLGADKKGWTKTQFCRSFQFKATEIAEAEFGKGSLEKKVQELLDSFTKIDFALDSIHKQLDEIFKLGDQNGDGYLDYKEALRCKKAFVQNPNAGSRKESSAKAEAMEQKMFQQACHVLGADPSKGWNKAQFIRSMQESNNSKAKVTLDKVNKLHELLRSATQSESG